MGALVKLHLTSGPLHVPFLQAGTPSLLMLSMVEHPDISSLASNTASLVSLLLAPPFNAALPPYSITSHYDFFLLLLS